MDRNRRVIDLGYLSSSSSSSSSSSDIDTSNLVSVDDIANDLTTENDTKVLSAEQGVVLINLINEINKILASDDENLDELQEIVDYIKKNRDDLENLSIDSIAGLQEILDSKSDITHNHNLADLSEKSYNSLTDVPTTFEPTEHTHTISDVANLQDELDNKSNIDHNHNLSDLTEKSYNSLTDIPTEFPPTQHTHTIEDINDLQEELDNKSDTTHNHNLADLTEKSYNSLTDTPDLDAIADTKKVKINDSDTEGYLEDKISASSPLTIEQDGSALNAKLNYDEDIFELIDDKLSINQSLLNHSNEAYFIVKYTPNEEDWYLGSVNRNESTAVYNYLAIFDVNKGAYEVSNYGTLDVANEQHQYGTLKDGTDITTLRFKFPTAGRYRFDIAVTGQIDQTFTDDWFGIGLVKCNDDSEYETNGSLSAYGKSLTTYRYYKENTVSGKVIFNYTYTWSLEITEEDANDWWTLGLQSVDNLWSRKIAYSFMLLDK